MIRSIFSVDQRGGLGNKGTLPWPSDTEDLKWFAEHTKGHVVVMGRRTWEDPKMPKPLPDRINVVLTTSPMSNPDTRLVYVRSGDPIPTIKAIEQQWSGKDIWIIGGAALLEQTIDICDEMYIAHRKGGYFTDTRIDINRYLSKTRITSSAPNQSRTINWCIYKNIDVFRPL